MSTSAVHRGGLNTLGTAGPKEKTATASIESTGDRSIFSTWPSSRHSDGQSVSSDNTRPTSAASTGPTVSVAPTKPGFAQRWPRLSRMLRVAVAVLAFPLLVTVNTVAIPLVHLVALCSRGLGDGRLAESLGKSAWARRLWGEDFARRLATDDLPLLLMAACFVFPGLVPLQSLWFSSQRALELVEGRTTEPAEQEGVALSWSRFDKYLKDLGVDPDRFVFRNGEWRPVY